MILPAADIVILTLILLSAVIGLFRGLVREVVSLAIWASAIVGATVFASPVAVYLTVIEASQQIRVVVAFVIVFFGVLSGLCGVPREDSSRPADRRLLGVCVGRCAGVGVIALSSATLRANDWA